MKTGDIHSNMHERVAASLRNDILGLALGTKLDSVKVLSERYQVSIITVRMALNHLQQEGLVDLRPGSGCYVTAPVDPESHIAILVECDILTQNVSLFYRHTVQQLRLFFREQGEGSRLYIGHAGTQDGVKPLTCLDFLEERDRGHIRGVAAIATVPDESWAAALREKGIPMVGMGMTNCWTGAVVNPDSAGFVKNAMRWLAGQGCRNPAMLSWCPPQDFSNPKADVFQAAVLENGMQFRPEWRRMDMAPLLDGAGWAGFREIWATSGARPDCLVVCDDILFRDACPAIVSAGIRVPDDLRIVLAMTKGDRMSRPVPVTRWDIDPVEFAREMGTTLLAMMSGDEPVSRNIVVPYRLADSRNGQEEGEAECMNLASGQAVRGQA